MKECWSEGALRAYLDRELPPEDMQRVAEHLEVCSECGDHWTELAGRASRVSALLGSLNDDRRPIPITRTPRRAVIARWRWAGVVAALAAGILLGLAFLPKRQPPVAVTVPPPVRVTPPAIEPVEPVETVRQPGIMNAMARPERPRTARASKRPSLPQAGPVDDFIALYDEPINTGVVLRVELGPKGVPADVVFGSDGRPHAIRLVNEKTKY